MAAAGVTGRIVRLVRLVVRLVAQRLLVMGLCRQGLRMRVWLGWRRHGRLHHRYGSVRGELIHTCAHTGAERWRRGRKAAAFSPGAPT